jgi:hypothetical protein
MDIANLIQTVAIYALPVLFAITVHEAAHGYVARYFGDNTAWMLGRVTLNPIKHIDPIGTILMPLLLYFAIPAGTFLFGYAKPVPVQFGNLRNPKRDMIWVALAGPGPISSRPCCGASCFTFCGRRRDRALLPQDGQGRHAGQPGDVRLQPVPAAAAGRRPRAGRPAARAQACGLAHRALGLLHRDGAGDFGRRQQPLAAPLMDAGYSVLQTF